GGGKVIDHVDIRGRLFGTMLGSWIIVAGGASAYAAEFLESMEDAWARRGSRVGAFHCEWTEETRMDKGFWSNPDFDPDEKAYWPNKDIQFMNSYELTVDEFKLRYEWDTHRWSPSRNELVKGHQTTAYDGQILVDYWPRGFGEDPHAAIGSMEAQLSDKLLHFPVMPWNLTFFPMNKTVGIIGNECSVQELIVTGKQGNIDGHNCQVLQIPDKLNKRREKELWVAPDLDYSVLRVTTRRKRLNGSKYVAYQFDISYERDRASDVWVPRTWTCVERDRGVEKLCLSTVSHFEMNPHVDIGHFRLKDQDFVDGTYVDYPAEPEKLPWIKLGDGKRRVVRPEE
ncbi:MAG: hypothetical protein R6U98_01290, partial [Pirellulaceae bacterium]